MAPGGARGADGLGWGLEYDGASEDTFGNKHTRAAVLAATALVASALDAVVRGEARCAFACVRPPGALPLAQALSLPLPLTLARPLTIPLPLTLTLTLTLTLGCVLRPGHHAGWDGRTEEAPSQGFCFFNNVACAAKRALDVHGLSRVCIVDFDVHHGNGTEEILSRDPRCLLISLHAFGQQPTHAPPTTQPETQAGQSFRAFGTPPAPVTAPHAAAPAATLAATPAAPAAPAAAAAAAAPAAPCAFYPGTGGRSCNATTANEPLPLRYTAAALWQRWGALRRRVLEFRPALLLLSSGFDAHAEDPSEVCCYYTYIPTLSYYSLSMFILYMYLLSLRPTEEPCRSPPSSLRPPP